jgi:hypothetical protein
VFGAREFEIDSILMLGFDRFDQETQFMLFDDF